MRIRVVLPLVVVAFAVVGLAGGIGWQYSWRRRDSSSMSHIAFIGPSMPLTVNADDIWIVNEDGSGPRNLTNSDAKDWSPTWSPDGTRLAFISQEQTGELSISIDDIDTGEISQVSLGVVICLDELSWSPDGTRLLFAGDMDCDIDGGHDGLYVVPLDGTGLVNLSNDVGGRSGDDYPSWSPDGRQIAFTSYVVPDHDLFVMQANGSDVRRLDTGSVVPTWGRPRWSPDGTQLAWFGRDASDSLDDVKQNLYIAAVDGSGIRQLTSGNEIDSAVAWSPDGKQIAVLYVDLESNHHWLTVLDAETGADVMQIDTQWLSNWVGWSPDGSLVYWAAGHAVEGGGFTGDILTISPDDGVPRTLTEGMGYVQQPVWSPER